MFCYTTEVRFRISSVPLVAQVNQNLFSNVNLSMGKEEALNYSSSGWNIDREAPVKQGFFIVSSAQTKCRRKCRKHYHVGTKIMQRATIIWSAKVKGL